MKNIHKIFIFIFLFMVSSVVCFADGSELKQQLNMVCQGQNISLTGCMYTEANKNTYEKLPIGTQKMISFDSISTPQRYVYFDIESISFKRAYTSINKNSQTVVGMCHTGYVSTTPYKVKGGQEYYKVTSNRTSADDIGVVYLSTYNTNADKNCKKQYSSQYVFQDKDKGYTKFLVNSMNADGGLKEIDTTDYEAYKNLTCPKYFLYSSNLGKVQSWFRSEKEYVFTDNKDVEFETNWFDKFLKVNMSGQIAGCLENAVDGNQYSTKCYDEKVEYITSQYKCPDKLSDFKLDVKSYIEECAARYAKENNIDLESARYLASQTSEYAPKLIKAGNDKINECYTKYLKTDCNLTDTEQTTVINKFKSGGCDQKCDQGTKPDNMDPNGKCYSCRGSTNVTQYVWSTNVPSGCGVNDKPMEECYGNKTNEDCRNCYKNAVSSLTDEKKTCVLNLTQTAQQAQDDNTDNVNGAFQEDENNTNEANTQTMDDIWNNSNNRGIFNIPGLSDADFGPDDQTCKEILKDNLISIIKSFINIIRIAGVIIAIGNGMITLIPAVISKDADGLKKAEKKLVTMAIVLAAIGIFPTFVSIIGGIFGFDLTCIFPV